MDDHFPIFSLLSDEQMSNKVRVEHQPDGHGVFIYIWDHLGSLAIH